MARTSSRTAPALTPAQKAAITKRRNGLDLSAVAARAQATRLANIEAIAKAARAAARKARKAAKAATPVKADRQTRAMLAAARVSNEKHVAYTRARRA